MQAQSVGVCWKIDADRSSLTFRLRHGLLGEIRGRFRCWGGYVWLATDDPSSVAVHVWAELSSLDTGSRARNDAIFASELFDVCWEPAIVFDSERFEPGSGGPALAFGWLSLHSFRKRIAVSIEEAGLAEVGPSNGRRFVGSASAAIDRHAFGLRRQRRPRDWLSEKLVGQTIEVTAHVEATPTALSPEAVRRMSTGAPGALAPISPAA
jgi:polyisoprenoid-binding protein YceI